MTNNLDTLIEKYLNDIIEIRRDIHQYPEIGMEEVRTSALVKAQLEKLGLEVQDKIGKMGVVGLLRGKKPGKTILLRADMDCLPMDELTDLPFKSKVPGMMHACGHDVHTAILLGAAKVLSELKDEIKGNIKFVFQPAEEANPTGGARYMIEDGVLENPKVDAAVALHVWNLPLGKVGIRTSTMMAQSDRIFITVKGKSSHASQPHNGVDAIVTAGHIITALQTVISRNVDPMESAVVTIGTIHGGSRYNVTCDKVVLEGTVRTFNPEISAIMPTRIKAIAENVATALGAECDVEYVEGYSATVNDEELATKFIGYFKDAIGEQNVVIPSQPASGGEDFSEFTKLVPSVFYWLGMESEMNKGKTTVHNPNLVVDEGCIPVGIKTLVSGAINFLNE